jgi:hypothetical protein
MMNQQFTCRDDGVHPVELLRDGRGIYGIGIPEGFETYEDVALRCGIEHPESCYLPRHDPWWCRLPRPLILRPDWIRDLKPGGCAVLQMVISGGPRGGPFRYSHEESLRDFIHREKLKRTGVQLWQWSGEESKEQKDRGRRVHHGLRVQSQRIINSLIGKLLEEAADMEAVRAARRFAFMYRESIYRACALSRRAMQLTETFPVLAVLIYSAGSNVPDERRSYAAHLVDRGARLRDVAGAMGIPMALRCVKPGAVHLVREFCERPELICSMPGTTQLQRLWLRTMDWALKNTENDFAAWAARRIPELAVGRQHYTQIEAFLADIVDWVRAVKPAGSRHFTPTMSVRTVTELSAAWHEAIHAADYRPGPDSAFPAPWFPETKIGDIEIVPIMDAASLHLEGKAMHHCISQYVASVLAGRFYAYSIRREGERVATLGLKRSFEFEHDNCIYKAEITQIRGHCNAEPPQAITAVVRSWLREQPRLLAEQPGET